MLLLFYICSVVVDDGTSCMIVTLQGESVRQLLHLTVDQWMCVEREVAVSGEVFIQPVQSAYTLSSFHCQILCLF